MTNQFNTCYTSLLHKDDRLELQEYLQNANIKEVTAIIFIFLLHFILLHFQISKEGRKLPSFHKQSERLNSFLNVLYTVVVETTA